MRPWIGLSQREYEEQEMAIASSGKLREVGDKQVWRKAENQLKYQIEARSFHRLGACLVS